MTTEEQAKETIDQAIKETDAEQNKQAADLAMKVILAQAGLTTDRINSMKGCPFCGMKVRVLIEAMMDPEKKVVRGAMFGLKCINMNCFFFMPPIIPMEQIAKVIEKFDQRRVSSAIILPHEIRK